MEKIFPDKGIIIDYLKKSIDNENLELECVFDSKLVNKSIFLNIIERLKEFNDFTYEDTTLDIRLEQGRKLSDIRITINGLEEIKKYCKTNSLENIDKIDYVKKNVYKENKEDRDSVLDDKIYHYKLLNKDFDYRLNIKSEIELGKENPEVLNLITDYSEKLKMYRYKKRYSFISYDKLFRFDVTVVKSSNVLAKSKTFKQANILNQKEIYEVEIEYIGSNIDDNGTKQISEFYKEIEKYESPYNLYSKKSPNPYGLLTPVDFQIYSDALKSTEIKFNPEKSIFKHDSGFKGILKVKDIDEDIQDIEDNINLFKEQLEDAEPENIDDLKDLIDQLESEKRELEKGKSELEKVKSGGGKNKIPEWAKKARVKVTQILDKDLLSEKLFEIFKEHIYYILTIIHDTKNIITNSEKINILEKYKKLTNQKCRIEQLKIQLPQPVTLALKDINPNNPDSILLKYAVTEKADGDRYILYITNNLGYLINSKKDIIFTGVEFPDLGKDYIFDGEYITKDIDDNDIKLFMIFDVYYEIISSTNNPVHKLPFHSTTNSDTFSSRYNIIKEFKQNILSNIIIDENSIEIDIKKYEFGKFGSKEKIGSVKYLNDCVLILDKCNNILKKSDKKSFRYRIDGLIFLPLFNSVKGKDGSDIPNYIGGKWLQNFKWKPPEENTIDFQVKYVKEKIGHRFKEKEIPYTIKNDDGSEVLNKYKQLQLFVGYDKKDDKKIDFCMRILDDVVEDKGKIIPFSPDDIHILYTSNVKMDIKLKKIICERDNLEIKENDIVEMRYNELGKNHMIWEPLRIRDDKIEPQYFTVANSVWDTIQNPVTENFIRNKIKLKDYLKTIEEEKNKYYISSNNNPVTEPLRKLHNYIKSNLIIGVCSTFKEKINILDLSIGRGGDIKKYIQRDTNAKFILGLDISSNVSEACERYYNERKGKPKAVFLVADTSKKISNANCFDDIEASEKEIKHSETMLNILYNLNKPVPKEYKNIQKKYNNLALEKFNVISSQFTLHYYFEDESTFEGLMHNVKENIAPGGYFIGCCYDGAKIFDALKDNNIEFRDTNDHLIYSIEKKYDVESFNEDSDNIFGQTIDVYMESIGQVIPEYLVNFNFLKHYMEQNGFKLISPNLVKVKNKYSGILKQNNITDDYGDFKKIIENLPELSYGDDNLQKGGIYEKAMDILQNTKLNDDGSIKELGYEKLRLLSSFNNYFIFQKV